jgi:hypothetical protein
LMQRLVDYIKARKKHENGKRNLYVRLTQYE